MNRMFLLASLLLLGMAPSVEAVSITRGFPKSKPPDKNCVPDHGCPKGMHSPKCCKPPPCEFLDALQRARAKRDLYWDKFASRGSNQESSAEDELAPLVPPGEEELAPLKPVKFDSRDYEKFKDDVSDAMNKARKKFPKCPKRRYPDPPIFTAMPKNDCAIEVYNKKERSFKEITLEQAQAESGSCFELVEAKYAAGAARASTCAVEVMDEENYTERASSLGGELDAEYDSLLAAMQLFWSRCSIKPGSKLAREMAARGISELKFNPPEPPKKKGPSRKSGKRGR